MNRSEETLLGVDRSVPNERVGQTIIARGRTRLSISWKHLPLK